MNSYCVIHLGWDAMGDSQMEIWDIDRGVGFKNIVGEG